MNNKSAARPMDELETTLTEIAEALGCTKKTASLRAKKESWAYEKATCRGGKANLYTLDDLPKEVSSAVTKLREIHDIELEKRHIEAQLSEGMLSRGKAFADSKRDEQIAKDKKRTKRLEEGRKKFSELTQNSHRRLRANARHWMLKDLGKFKIDHECGIKKAQELYSAALSYGDIKLPENIIRWMPVLNGKIHVSNGTLQRWRDDYRNHGLWGLVSGYGATKGRCKIKENRKLFDTILGLLGNAPHITGTQIFQFLKADVPHLASQTSERSIQSFIKNWKKDNHQVWTNLTNPDKWKNNYKAAVGSHFENITELNQLWELDSTPADWMLIDGRHSVVGAIDMYSRRLKYFVSKTSTAAAVKQVIRRSILDWGVPDAVRTDNGKDYVSVEVDALLEDLDIEHLVCLPYASEQKGTIERAMRTLNHGILELLPGFIGHNVAERKVIEARKSFAERMSKKGEIIAVELTSVELQKILDDWCEDVYAKNPHKGLKGKTPWAVANAWTGNIRRISDEHALDELMTPIAGVRVVGKKGISFNNRVFIDPAGLLYEHIGDPVTLRYDEQDIGRLAVYFDGVFLCWAQDPDATGIDRAEAAAAVTHEQKKWLAEQSAEFKAATRGFKKDIAQTVLNHRIDESSTLTSLPKPSVEHCTPALEEAARAAQARTADSSSPQQDHELVAQADREVEIIPLFKQSEPFATFGDDDEKYKLWKKLDAQTQAGTGIDNQRLQNFYRSYPSDPAFSALKYCDEYRMEFEQAVGKK